MSNYGKILDLIEKQTREVFSPLTYAQIFWKPREGAWSVGECLSHIIITNELYFPVLENAARSTHRESLWERVSPFSRMFGKQFIGIVDPESDKKHKSPRAFMPDKNFFETAVDKNIIRRFKENIIRLRKILKEFKTVNTAGIKISSPASSLITFKLRDALEMILKHNIRHLNQALRVMDEHGFPR